jgi:hypothetical protein
MRWIILGYESGRPNDFNVLFFVLNHSLPQIFINLPYGIYKFILYQNCIGLFDILHDQYELKYICG